MNKHAGITSAAIILIIVFLAGAFMAVKILSNADESLIEDCKDTCEDLDYTYFDVGTNLNIVADGAKDTVWPSNASKYCWCLDDEGSKKRVEVDNGS